MTKFVVKNALRIIFVLGCITATWYFVHLGMKVLEQIWQ